MTEARLDQDDARKMTMPRSMFAFLLLGTAPAALLAQAAAPPATATSVQPPADDPDDAAAADEEYEQTITVTGTPRPLPGAVIGDIPPELQLSPADIRAYGVGTVDELLAELAPETGSGQGRGGERPVVLLNGRRISSFRELRDVPTEAILRVDILPEEVALRYGYAATQKVVNIVLRRRFRALTAEARAGTSTEGGGENGRAGLDLLHLRGDSRLNLDVRYERSAALRESQRDITPTPPDRPFATGGNVTGAGGPGTEIDPALSALAGAPVTIAGVPGANPTLDDFAGTAGRANATDLAHDRTLRGASDELRVNAVFARPLSQSISATFNAGLEASGSESLNGLAGYSLLVPAGDPFSPFGTDVALDRYADGVLLRQSTASETLHAGLGLQGALGSWHWTLTGNYERADSRTRTVRGIGVAPLQDRLDAGDPALDPFGAIPGSAFGPLAIDRARSITNTGNAELVAYGSLLDLPAGAASTTVKLGGEALGFDSRSTRGGVDRETSLSRRSLDGQVSLDLPITSRRRHFGAAIGDLSANFNAAADRLSDFGTITTLGYGLTWRPTSRISLLWSMTTQEGAPSVQQLGNPQVLTPDVPVFDFTNGQTVFVTRLTGGNPGLEANRRHVFKLGVTARLMDSPRLTFNANYDRVRTTNAIAALPAATAALETAFPERFIRDGDGDLAQIDARPVNFARERRDQLRWGINLSVPLHASEAERRRLAETFRAAAAARRARRAERQAPNRPSEGEGQTPASAGGQDGEASSQPPAERGAGRRGGFGRFGGGRRGGRGDFGAGRLQFSLHHTWIFRDDILIREGVPLLDLLDGDAAGASGGQARHQLQLRAGYSKGGLGARLSANWQSGTVVRAGPRSVTGDLHFSPLATADLRLFADVSQLGHLGRESWARGLRITLSIDNLFNQRQRVRDATGATPLSYQPDYLDPLGRTARLTIRKLFF